ncbi:hypothetical protein Cjcuy013_04495 [Campylobacter jejuni]|nr:hypothetical protein [Campylobacter jejuni]MBC5860943.1 hypothetical protein [Campylobacter jejuni]
MKNFKDSGIEWLWEIPQHWELVKLKYIISDKLTYGVNETAELSIKESINKKSLYQIIYFIILNLIIIYSGKNLF